MKLTNSFVPKKKYMLLELLLSGCYNNLHDAYKRSLFTQLAVVCLVNGMLIFATVCNSRKKSSSLFITGTIAMPGGSLPNGPHSL